MWGLSALRSCIITRMSIQEVWGKFKDFWQNSDILLVLIIVATALLSFMLGRYSVLDITTSAQTAPAQSANVVESKLEYESKQLETASNTETNEPPISTPGKYVASKSGTKYHLPWCGSAKQIKESNKIWFNTKEEADKAGYTPAANCKGI